MHNHILYENTVCSVFRPMHTALQAPQYVALTGSILEYYESKSTLYITLNHVSLIYPLLKLTQLTHTHSHYYYHYYY